MLQLKKSKEKRERKKEMIEIILFILLGLKMKMEVAYWCIVGLFIVQKVLELLTKVALQYKKEKVKKEIEKDMDEMIDKLKKQRSSLEETLKKMEEESPITELKGVENLTPPGWHEEKKQEETTNEQ